MSCPVDCKLGGSLVSAARRCGGTLAQGPHPACAAVELEVPVNAELGDKVAQPTSARALTIPAARTADGGVGLGRRVGATALVEIDRDERTGESEGEPRDRAAEGHGTQPRREPLCRRPRLHRLRCEIARERRQEGPQPWD